MSNNFPALIGGSNGATYTASLTCSTLSSPDTQTSAASSAASPSLSFPISPSPWKCKQKVPLESKLGNIKAEKQVLAVQRVKFKED